MFPQNVGSVDQVIRVVLGLAMIAAFFLVPGMGAWGWALWIGIIPLATGLVSWCPIYAALGVSSAPKKRA